MSVDSARTAARPPGMPPGLLGAALLLWGWQHRLLELAVPMAVLHEMAPWVQWRWRFSAAHFIRLVDLTAVLFVVAAVYQFDSRAVHGVYGLLGWLPMLLFGLLLAQRYSEAGRIGLGALLLGVRRALARGDLHAERSIDFALPFFAATLLSATVGEVRGPALLAGLLLLVTWGLVQARNGRRTLAWGLALALALGLGVAGQAGLREARRALDPLIMDLLREYVVSRRQGFSNRTRIGDVGRLKGLERIEMRVHAGAGGHPPGLLREATYRVFSRDNWLVGQETTRRLSPGTGATEWTLHAQPADLTAPDASAERLHISRYLQGGGGLLALPPASLVLHGLAAEQVEQHRFGAVEVRGVPELAQFSVLHRPQSVWAAAPDAVDLALPQAQQAMLAPLLRRLQLDGLPPAQAVRRIEALFASGFSYSLAEDGWRRRTLEDFLLHERSGHCEYFATATVLLLRAAGVPARYATGYAVQEWSALENAYIVRRRHAHAWALAHVNGQWRQVDTTPAGWAAIESAQSPWWRGVHDLWSFAWFRVDRWRWGEDDSQQLPWLAVLALPLVVLLGTRLRARRVRIAPQRGTDPRRRQVQHSPLLAVTRCLHDQGHAAAPGETLPAFIHRLRLQGLRAAAELDEALRLHQRLRFDPAGLGPAEMNRLQALCRTWMQHHAGADSRSTPP